ncbi:Predicted kinase, aminoglycoside phosphotransferase (APT) family [Microlunatus soli]|uniref:Predicted kinase, aminoglycoside phosphotransferase (APT) family n=1 Tax=Microlunatus soli TaxID=630515 RepID=A0A1H1U2K6_9ACTN|nr:Predicted kinase, aminoglycoside phosphotransferase (APT) family [Microlunatus soli]
MTVAPRQGQVNLTIYLGSDLVLRLPRQRRFEERLVKEAEVIGLVRDRGIPTAELVSFDATHELGDNSYIVLERLHGREIGDLPSLADGGDRIYGSLFEILTGLHAIRRDVETSVRSVGTADFSVEELLDELTSGGEIGRTQAGWLQRWFSLLESRGARRSEPVLLHGDVMPSNLILNDSGDVSAIIDWGSACWGEPMRDLAGFRTSALPDVVDAYRQVACRQRTPAEVAALEASVLWYQLFFALAKLLGRPSSSETRNWSAPRGARLLEILRFFTTAVPDRWRQLLQQD